MGTLRILNSKGDTAVSWDLDSKAAIKEAEKIFNEARAKGSTAFKTDVTPAARIDQFDVAAKEIIIVPRIAGG